MFFRFADPNLSVLKHSHPFFPKEMMKYSGIGKIFLWIVSGIILFHSCSEEIDMYTSGKTVPVVYALLNPDSSMQYIRVGQSFSYYGEDSILTNSKLTYLEEDFEIYISYTDNTGSKKIVWFEPTDAPVRDSGLFANEELQLLSAELEIANSTVYKLYLHLKESDLIVYAELNSFDKDFEVIDPLDVSFRTINLFTGEDFYFRMVTVSPRAVYQAHLNFNYKEIYQGSTSEHSLDFPLDIVFGEDNDVLFVSKRFSGENFLKDIGKRIDEKDGAIRVALGLDFFISAGGEELYYLIKSTRTEVGFNAMSNTNLFNAVGVFSTLSHRTINNIPLSEYSLDSLALSQYTRHLGFKPYTKQKP